MKLLMQIALVFGLYWISQGIEAILPFAFPASVISMVLLLILLLLRIVKPEHIKEKSDFLLGNLSFFFLPATVSIMNYVDVIWQNLIPFITICVVSTVVTFAAAAWAVRLANRLLERKEGAK